MTFGIDISGHQLGIDLKLAKFEGCEFVLVKASGFNTGRLYVADGYHTLIDRAIVSGFGRAKGHYYLIGGGQRWLSPTDQARYFVGNLYRLDKAHDVLMLDNEGLDSNGYLFNDKQVDEFCREVVRLTGIPARRVWVYAGANDWRNLAPWPRTVAADYSRVWAAYGSRPTGKVPDHDPELRGSIPSVDVHQYTSNAAVAGLRVDGDYSRHGLDVLFGGVEMVTEATIRKWLAGYERDWNQRCQALMWQLANRFGRVVSTPPSAILAYHVERQAGRIHTGSTPPPGSFVYFDIGRDGHVGFVMNEGRVLMATSHLVEELVDSDAGWNTIDGYVRATGADYIGWSMQNGGNTVPFTTAGGSTAGGGAIIIEEKDMSKEYPTRFDYRPSIDLEPGEKTQLKLPNGADMDVTDSGSEGRALLTGHVYAKGEAGDGIDIVFIWYDIARSRGSNHFVERAVFDKSGTVNANVTFQRPKVSGYRIYMRVQAPSSNESKVTVSVLSADAALLN